MSNPTNPCPPGPNGPTGTGTTTTTNPAPNTSANTKPAPTFVPLPPPPPQAPWINPWSFPPPPTTPLVPQPSAQETCSPTPKKSDGCTCKKCKEFFPYAEPNQEDGTLICYVCRKVWV